MKPRPLETFIYVGHMRVINRKPDWLRKKINLADYSGVRALISRLRLNTVCREARCPNIGECFSRRQATFLILGDTCTRSCRFCAVNKGKPSVADYDEHNRVVRAAKSLNLKHIVITSVTRDDLSDGGAGIFARTILSLRQAMAGVTVEALIPDFGGNYGAIAEVVSSGPDIIAHNLETVPALYPLARQDADYQRSLKVLKAFKIFNPGILAKSGIMLGLGESRQEVIGVFADLRAAGCDFLSIGQYLAPSKNHLPVQNYVTPEEFDAYKQKAVNFGFSHVESGPYVRSSYLAHKYLEVK